MTEKDKIHDASMHLKSGGAIKVDFLDTGEYFNKILKHAYGSSSIGIEKDWFIIGIDDDKWSVSNKTSRKVISLSSIFDLRFTIEAAVNMLKIGYKIKYDSRNDPKSFELFHYIFTLAGIEVDHVIPNAIYSINDGKLVNVKDELVKPFKLSQVIKTDRQFIIKQNIPSAYEMIVEAVQYGFDYRGDSMNDGISVPKGNVEQWIFWKLGIKTLKDLEKLKHIRLK